MKLGPLQQRVAQLRVNTAAWVRETQASDLPSLPQLQAVVPTKARRRLESVPRAYVHPRGVDAIPPFPASCPLRALSTSPGY